MLLILGISVRAKIVGEINTSIWSFMVMSMGP
jgi:hypothetical protein